VLPNVFHLPHALCSRLGRCAATVAVALALHPVAAQVAGEEPPEKSVRIQRAAEPPVIDGVLNEEVWQRAPVIDDLHQVSPVEFAEPSERTEVYILYDRDALYVGVRMFDSEPQLINARILRQGQAIGSDDRFFLHIDPFNSRRGGYLFGVNPNGVRFDGIFEGITQRQFDWDGVWQAAARITADGWVVEMEIPFKTLSFDPTQTTWRMNFARNIERTNEGMAWNSRNRNTDLSTMGAVTGISQIEQGLGLDVVPSMSVHEQRLIGNVPAQSDAEPSLDVFYKITPQLNAALTINTDFSATEVDDRQVNLTRFSLFFPERRDFFLQDADIFQFGRLQQDGRPYFSRKIGISATGVPVPIDVGGRVSGRIGRFDIGTLAVRQEAFQNIDAETAFVGRVAANVLAESSVGMIVTDGDPATNVDNSVVGVDFRYFNSRLLKGRGVQGDAWIQQSDTPGLDGDDSAVGVRASVPSNTGFRGVIGFTRFEPNFNPALGFVRRRGVDNGYGELAHTWRPADSLIRTISSGVFGDRIEYLDDGSIQTQTLNLQAVNVELDSQDQVSLSVSNQKEGLREPFMIYPGVVIPPGLYSFDNTNVSIRSGDQRALGAGFFMNDGEFYDGTRFGATMFFGFRSRHFRTNLNYQYNDIVLPGGAFETRVVRLQLEAIFSSKLSWVNLIQYDNLSRTVGINSRLHWIPKAGREGFLVLNHNLRDDILTPESDFHTSFADVTLKYSYTFRF
jgi:hypothetical protein